MKKLLTLKNILICIAFTVFLLFVKDNIVIVWGILSTIVGILMPFIIGFLIAYILNFPYKFFYTKVFSKVGKKRKSLEKLRKPLSIVCTYTAVVAVLVILLAIVIPQIVINVSSLVESMPEYYDSFSKYFADFIGWLNSTFNAGIDENKIFNDLVSKIMSFSTGNNAVNIAGIAGETTTAIINMLTNTTTGLYNFAMGVIISVYFLAAKENLCRQVKKLAVALIPIRFLPKIYEIIDITDTKCGRFLVGDIIDSALVGVLHFIVMSICQLPYAPLIAVLIGVTNIIPFFGPFIGSIPSTILLFIVNPWDALWFLVINIVIQQLDGNLFKPKIIGGQVGLSSFWVLFSVLVGGALFGVVGLILGTPIYAVIYSLVRKKVHHKIDDKGKIAQEALDFEVLNYAKIAEEQRKIREEKENQQKEKLKKLIGLNKSDGDITESDKNDSNKTDE